MKHPEEGDKKYNMDLETAVKIASALSSENSDSEDFDKARKFVQKSVCITHKRFLTEVIEYYGRRRAQEEGGIIMRLIEQRNGKSGSDKKTDDLIHYHSKRYQQFAEEYFNAEEYMKK